ncbi:MAG: oxidoreductase domain protein [Verrucomicrobia bacterium]|nr:oxidoreductase domain protein [Verrucomicrobiota bacterium]
MNGIPSTMSDARTIGFGIVGTGSIADFHARAIAQVPGARLYAVASRDAAKARVFAEAHGTVADGNPGALLRRPEIDVVCVTTPSGAHGEIALPALAAGKHVLCEKPLEISTERIDRLIQRAEECGRFLGVVLPARMGDGAVALKRAVEAGRFGRLTLCSAAVRWWRTEDYYRAGKWRGTWELDGGGALMNQGIHAVDLLVWLAGMPSTVTAHAATLAHAIAVEDTLAASLRFAHGGLGSIECATSCAPGSPRRIEISGTRGSAALEDDRLVRWAFDEPQPHDAEILTGASGPAAGGGSSDPRAIGTEGHRRVVAEMAAAIRAGRPPAIDGREGRRSVAVIEALYAAARTQSPQSPR